MRHFFDDFTGLFKVFRLRKPETLISIGNRSIRCNKNVPKGMKRLGVSLHLFLKDRRTDYENKRIH